MNSALYCWTIDYFIEKCYVCPTGSGRNNTICYLSSFLENCFLLRYVIATWGLVMSKIFPGSEDIFSVNQDGVAVGRCKGDVVLVMVLQVGNSALMEKLLVYGVIPALGQF